MFMYYYLSSSICPSKRTHRVSINDTISVLRKISSLEQAQQKCLEEDNRKRKVANNILILTTHDLFLQIRDDIDNNLYKKGDFTFVKE